MKNSEILQAIAAIDALPALKDAPDGNFILALNLVNLRGPQKAIMDARLKIFEDVFELEPGQPWEAKYPPNIPEGTPLDVKNQMIEECLRALPNYPKADRDFKKVLEMDSEFRPSKLTKAQLNLKDNPLSPSHLAALMPLIEQ